MTFQDFDLRGKLAIAELHERIVEAALDQRQPSDDLRGALQQLLTYTKHRDRDKSRDRRHHQR